MTHKEPTYFDKIKWSLPWLTRYPFERAGNYLRSNSAEKKHVIITVANHFEPAWSENGWLDLDTQLKRLDDYYKLAEKTGDAVRDADGTKFRHTNFFPIEQYDSRIVNKIQQMESEDLGELEIHLHHGLEKPDTAENLRNILIEYRDRFAEEHRCLSRLDGKGDPTYAFVHGNLALANSMSGKYCGVDNEMQILAETGCYADFTLPSAPLETQSAITNKIYECGLPLNEKFSHRTGENVRVFGNKPQLPLIFTGPLMFNWNRRIKGVPVPRLDDGALTVSQSLDSERFDRWLNANITVTDRPEWIFVKLYCHGFFDQDQKACIGEDAQRFFGEMVERGEKSGDYTIHFASAREAANIVFAAIDGKNGNPNDFRDYRLKAIMKESRTKKNANAENYSDHGNVETFGQIQEAQGTQLG